ncbi:MAG TPA: GspE/PulE family protein [Spirochaetia bacterium]|nr:GspE/PulE family protein [Spirochaetia bacterium]
MSGQPVATPGSIYDFGSIPEGASQYPLEYVEANRVLKLQETEELVTIGTCEEVSDRLLQSLRLYHRKPVTFHGIEGAELSAFLGRRLSGDSADAASVGDGDQKLPLDRLANDAPIVNLVNSLLIEAIRCDASDVHIESYADRVVVRYRVDGALRVAGSISPDRFRAVSSRIKIMANLNIMERRLPQDGRISVHLAGKPFDLRVSIVPVIHGESIVLRLFQKTGVTLLLDELGLDESQVQSIRRCVAFPHGLLLITGPTGSGKTTTLTAILQEIRSDERKIVTIEDPVEYAIDGICQIPTNDLIGLSFDSLLRRVVRQDPNVIMIGEIRDAATAQLAVRAAQTGRLVLSTLHTSDAVSAISRLVNMGIEPHLIAGVLRAVVAQRLVRRVCPDCARTVAATPAENDALELNGITHASLMHGAGCSRCAGTGYRGRVALAELFVVDCDFAQMIASRAHSSALAAALGRRGMRILAEDAYHKAAAGITTISEIEKVGVV